MGCLAAAGPGQQPPGWQQHFSEDGTPYFHNEHTGETAWDVPVERV